jgi:hypothetical protein
MATIILHPALNTRGRKRAGKPDLAVVFVIDGYDIREDLKARGYTFDQPWRGGSPNKAWSKPFETFEDAIAEVRELGLSLSAGRATLATLQHPDDGRTTLRCSLSADSFAPLTDEQLDMLAGCTVQASDGEMVL